MVKAMILDVDGVIVGEKEGINSPNPHPDIIAKLKGMEIPIALCTAKPAFAIESIITSAKLSAPHIADNGGLLIDSNSKIFKKSVLDNGVARRVVRALLENNIHTEVYTSSDYFIQSDQMCEMADKHGYLLQRMPHLVESLETFSVGQEITKIVAMTLDEESAMPVREILRIFEAEASITWTIHPGILPIQFAVVTAPNITKRQGAIDLSELLGVPLENIMGVGDSDGDWQFIELCGYGAAMGNASEGLKERVRSKGADRSYIGKHVDENGIIDIIDWGISR